MNWRYPCAWAMAAVLLGCADPAVPVGDVFGPCAKASCEDQNPCTQDSCEPTGQCRHAPLTGPKCDAAAPCLLQPTCQAGVCQGAPALWQQQSLLDKSLNDQLDAVVAVPGGGSLAVGRITQERDDGGTQDEAVLLRFSPTGAVAAQRIVAGKQHDDGLLAVAALPDSHYLAVGYEAELPSSVDPQPASAIAWIRADGELFGDRQLQKSPQRRRLRGVAVAQDGSPLAVGTSDGQGLAVRFYKDASSVEWLRELQPVGATSAELIDVVADRSKPVGWLAVGSAVQGGKSQAWLQRLGPSDADQPPPVLWAPPGYQAMAYQVVEVGDGTFAVLGVANASETPSANAATKQLLWRVGADLQPLWHRVSDGNELPARAAWLAEPGLLAAFSWAGDGTKTTAMFSWYDASGATLLRRVEPGQAAMGLAVLPGQRLAAVGRIGIANQFDGFATHLDVWGNRSCDQSGSCSGAPTGMCSAPSYCSAGKCQ